MRTSRLPSSMVAPHNNPRHSCESACIGLLSKKKIPSGDCAPLCLYFGLSPKISISNLIHDPVRDPAHDLIWSDPDFVDTVI